MELILPTGHNAKKPTVLEAKVLVVIGANGAGKSSFGRDLKERYAEKAAAKSRASLRATLSRVCKR